MELGWSALALLCIAAGCAWFWQDSLAARERANAAAMEACERLGLQFLDGTVAFARLQPVRELGWLRLRRTYVFDYTSNSIERRQGFVTVTAGRIETIGYAAADEDRMKQAHPAPPRARTDASIVLHIEDWRARRAEPPPRNEEDADER